MQAMTEKKVLAIEDVEMAAYLRQSGIVMQTSGSQLQISKQHLWAENLELSVPKYLATAMQSQSTNYQVYVRNLDYVPSAHYSLRLHIDNLQATDQGEVVSSGRYQLIDNEDSKQSITVDFYFERDLQEDGYSHAVAKIRELLSDIATDVISTAETFK
tara:strand:- start:1448 stop:1921 length:474 start_codon:yes stop_codon:yes gene_type:complete